MLYHSDSQFGLHMMLSNGSRRCICIQKMSVVYLNRCWDSSRVLAAISTNEEAAGCFSSVARSNGNRPWEDIFYMNIWWEYKNCLTGFDHTGPTSISLLLCFQTDASRYLSSQAGHESRTTDRELTVHCGGTKNQRHYLINFPPWSHLPKERARKKTTGFFRPCYHDAPWWLGRCLVGDSVFFYIHATANCGLRDVILMEVLWQQLLDSSSNFHR